MSNGQHLGNTRTSKIGSDWIANLQRMEDNIIGDDEWKGRTRVLTSAGFTHQRGQLPGQLSRLDAT
jgi:hypothetical protein